MSARSIVRLLGPLVLLAAAGGLPEAAARSDAQAAAEPPTDVSVTVAPVVRTTLHGYVTGWGTVAPESATADRPPADAAVAAPVPGIIAAIACAEGERVRQGATLFRLDSRVADVAVERAQQAVRFAQSVVARQEQLGPGRGHVAEGVPGRQAAARGRAEPTSSAAQVQRRLLDVDRAHRRHRHAHRREARRRHRPVDGARRDHRSESARGQRRGAKRGRVAGDARTARRPRPAGAAPGRRPTATTAAGRRRRRSSTSARRSTARPTRCSSARGSRRRAGCGPASSSACAS